MRVESLTQERRALATILFLIARLGYLSPHEIEKLVPWLQENPRHPISYYILCSLLAAFDLVDPQTPGGQLRQRLATYPSTLNLMRRKLDPTEEWKEAGVRATLQLKWTLFLTEARHRDSSLEHKDGFRTVELETNIWNAVQGHVFTFLGGSVAKLRRRDESFPSGSYAGPVIRFSEADQLQPLPDDDLIVGRFPMFRDAREIGYLVRLVRATQNQAATGGYHPCEHPSGQIPAFPFTCHTYGAGQVDTGTPKRHCNALFLHRHTFLCSAP